MSQFYKLAGRILRDLERKNGSLKSLIFNYPHADLRLKKKLYAILCKTVKCKLTYILASAIYFQRK